MSQAAGEETPYDEVRISGAQFERAFLDRG
jgi:hypothetical protein